MHVWPKMRRYRFGDPSKGSFRKWSSVIYFLAAWNLFGYVVYTSWKRKKESDPEWDKLSATQKYLQLISVGRNPMETVKIKGLSVEKDDEMDKSEP